MITRLIESVAGLPARWRGDGRTPPLPEPDPDVVRPSSAEPGDPSFCCDGCEAVTELIPRVRRVEAALTEIRADLENLK